MKRNYIHDCASCTFIGNAAVDDESPLDFYFCGESLIWRFGNEAPDYGSSRIDFITPLSIHGMIAFGLYLRFHEVAATNAKISGDFFSRENRKILSLS